MHACVCGLYLISALCHQLNCGLPSSWSIVFISPMYKDPWTAWTGELVCQAEAVQWGVGCV